MEFTPDEICITAENKFDDGIYQLLYGVWKETSGEYDPKDDKPIVDPRGNVHTQNETKFKYWAMEQYGMTAEEYRGYTVEGTLKTLEEIDTATSKTMLVLALPSIAKNAVKTVKDVAENGVHFDTSIALKAGSNGAEDIAENATKKEIIKFNSREVDTLLKGRPELEGNAREKLLTTVQDTKLAKIINELYRPGAMVGDGGTAAILVEEFNNGSSKHLKKAKERLKQLNDLANSGKLGLNDLDVVDALINDLEYAINLFK